MLLDASSSSFIAIWQVRQDAISLHATFHDCNASYQSAQSFRNECRKAMAENSMTIIAAAKQQEDEKRKKIGEAPPKRSFYCVKYDDYPRNRDFCRTFFCSFTFPASGTYFPQHTELTAELFPIVELLMSLCHKAIHCAHGGGGEILHFIKMLNFMAHNLSCFALSARELASEVRTREIIRLAICDVKSIGLSSSCESSRPRREAADGREKTFDAMQFSRRRG
jgi:hypothetical protein